MSEIQMVDTNTYIWQTCQTWFTLHPLTLSIILGIVAQDIIRFSSAKSENEKQAYQLYPYNRPTPSPPFGITLWTRRHNGRNVAFLPRGSTARSAPKICNLLPRADLTSLDRWSLSPSRIQLSRVKLTIKIVNFPFLFSIST